MHSQSYIYVRSTTEAPRRGVNSKHWTHSCHILPFQPILWNKYFPPEPANTAKHSPKSISEGGRIWQVCEHIALGVGDFAFLLLSASAVLVVRLWHLKWPWFPGWRPAPLPHACWTVGFHTFNLRIFNLRVSNPNKLIVGVFLTRCRISMCQGLGPTKHDEISEIDRIHSPRSLCRRSEEHIYIYIYTHIHIHIHIYPGSGRFRKFISRVWTSYLQVHFTILSFDSLFNV